MLAASRPHSYTVIGVDHAAGHALVPGWVWAFVILAYVALLVTGIVCVVRATRRSSRLSRIALAIVAVWTIAGAVAAFIDVYQGSDWAGSALSSSFIVVYGLAVAGVVLAIDWTARRLRGQPPAVEPQT